MAFSCVEETFFGVGGGGRFKTVKDGGRWGGGGRRGGDLSIFASLRTGGEGEEESEAGRRGMQKRESQKRTRKRDRVGSGTLSRERQLTEAMEFILQRGSTGILA